LAPLDVARLRAAAITPSGLWSEVRVVAETGSTNADLLGEAGRGAPEGLVLAAETQTSGRGRQGRAWQSLPGAALTFSVLLRPRSVPQAVKGWVPLLAGVAVATALRQTAAVDARLKWPNDVLLGGGKLAGILAEQSGEAIVAGTGINVLGQADELPVTTATSLELHAAGGIDRTALLLAVLGELETWYRHWSSAGDAEASGLREAYLRLSATVGQQVQVWLPGGQRLKGRAEDVDEIGRLLVRPDGGTASVAVTAGEVIHVR
jgi:BirA family biotin operon repressor/biotin-[acetyl-CoA-carboxylase] ligase